MEGFRVSTGKDKADSGFWYHFEQALRIAIPLGWAVIAFCVLAYLTRY